MCRCRYRPGFSRLPRVSESPIFIKGTFVATSSKARTDGAKTKLLPSRQPLLSARAQRGLHTARCSPAPHHPLSSCQNLPQLSLGLTCASFSAPRHNNNHNHPPPTTTTTSTEHPAPPRTGRTPPGPLPAASRPVPAARPRRRFPGRPTSPPQGLPAGPPPPPLTRRGRRHRRWGGRR